MPTKTRSDAILLNLSIDHVERLREALLGGMSYLDACAFAENELGVITNRNSMALFWKQECLPIRILRRAEAADHAAQIAAAAEELPGRFMEAAKQAVQQRFFEFSNDPAAKLAETTMLNDIIQREREILLKERESDRKDRAIAVQEGRHALEKQAAGLILKDRELAKHHAREKLMRDNTKKIVDDEMTSRLVRWSNALEVWQRAKAAGKDAGPRPEMDMEAMKSDVFARLGFEYPIPAQPLETA